MIKKLIFAGALLASAIAPASAAWRQATSKHFIIVSDQSESDLRALAERLERFDSALRADRVVSDPDKGPAARVQLFVVDDVNELRTIFGDSGSNVAGFYIPRAGGSYALMPRKLGSGSDRDMDAEGVLLHEYTHAFLNENFAQIAFPAWFQEGFAEFNMAARFNRDGSVDFGFPAKHRVYGLTQVTSVTMTDLLERKRKLDMYESDAFYGKSWLLTHMLTFDPDRQDQLGKLLSALNSGKSGKEAARQAFGDLDKLEVDMRSYLKRAKFDYKRIPAANIVAGTVNVRALTPAESAAIPIIIRSKRGVTSETAKTLVVDARRAAAPYPNDPAVQRMLTEAEFDAKNWDAAEAAADRALAADPKHLEAMLYKGMVKMERAKAAKAKDAATWREVRRWYTAANRIDPNNPLPLKLFYESFEAAETAPTANAVTGLLQAYQIAPQDEELRVLVARHHLGAGNAAEAKIALGKLAYDAHGHYVESANAVLKVFEEKGAAAALAEWNRLKKEAEEKQKAAEKKA